MIDYYKILGVNENADFDTIKKSYRKLALKFHPDRNPGEESEKKFKEINEAYGVLSDGEKKAQYDSMRQNPFGPGSPFGGQGGFEDVWSEFFGDFGDIFSQPSRRRKPARAPKPSVRFEIPLDQLVKEEVKQVFYHEEEENCSLCNGQGGKNPRQCQHCNGSGTVKIVHQAGAMRIQTTGACQACNGRGKVFEKICSGCYGVGKVKKKKKYRVTISTEEIN